MEEYLCHRPWSATYYNGRTEPPLLLARKRFFFLSQITIDSRIPSAIRFLQWGSRWATQQVKWPLLLFLSQLNRWTSKIFNIMGRQQTLGCYLVALIVLQLTLPALALPQLLGKFTEQGNLIYIILTIQALDERNLKYWTGRKFAVKPNSNKKVITETNEIAVKIYNLRKKNVLENFKR